MADAVGRDGAVTEPPAKFTATRDFWCVELESWYVAGLSYAFTPRNRPLAERWLRDGLIETAAPAARVAGRGSADKGE